MDKPRGFNSYYQDELSFLREMGKEFAKTHPALAHFLAEAGSDPDVERLLEGFAFLTGRIRQKLDDELPELTHTMMGLLWPHYLRPIPSMSIVEFEPQKTLRGRYTVPREKTELESAPITNTRCRFRTCYDVDLLPITLDEAFLEGQKLRLKFRLSNGVQFADLNLNRLRLNLHGEPSVKHALYLLLCRHIQKITIEGKDKQLVLGQSNVRPVGFDKSEAMLPYPTNSFVGYRILQEYFAFPDKFMFVDLTGLEPMINLNIESNFEVVFHFSRMPEESLRVGKDNIRLNCTPVVNLFSRNSEPIRIENDRTEYRVRPEGPNSHHYEVYSVDKVSGTIQGTAQWREYEPFYSFTHGLSDNVYYQTRLRNSVLDENTTETYISFINKDQSVVMPPTETISLELTCINRRLTEQIRLGEIRVPTSSSPEFARFRNITNVTPTIYPPLGGSLHWKLISHLTLSRLSIASKTTLRGILALYNFQSLYDRQSARENERRLDGISGVVGVERERLYRGAPIRGTEIQIDLQEDHFASEGDMYLFASILNEFIALYATINSFTRLTVKGVNYGELYEWPLRLGEKTLL